MIGLDHVVRSDELEFRSEGMMVLRGVHMVRYPWGSVDTVAVSVGHVGECSYSFDAAIYKQDNRFASGGTIFVRHIQPDNYSLSINEAEASRRAKPMQRAKVGSSTLSTTANNHTSPETMTRQI